MDRNYRKKLYEIIFEAETPAGKAFDLVLIILIVITVLAIILESVPAINSRYGTWLKLIEWVITILFTIEYIVRIWASPKSFRYISSFYGIIDFLAIIPTYLGVIFTGAMGFAVIRGLRLLRIFRILKITRYSNEGWIIIEALKASRVKILVFLFAVVTIVLIIGTMMYLIEGEYSGFTSIPASIYWTIVTLTTVGYGDMTPVSDFGKFIASFVMIIGYGIIAVPTGIVTFELATSARKSADLKLKVCPECHNPNNDPDALFCKLCGKEL